jgi:hypothetical protein
VRLAQLESKDLLAHKVFRVNKEFKEQREPRVPLVRTELMVLRVQLEALAQQGQLVQIPLSQVLLALQVTQV